MNLFEYAINFLHADEHDGELLAEDALGTLTVRELGRGRLHLSGTRLSECEVSSQQALRSALMEFPHALVLDEHTPHAPLLTPFGRAQVSLTSQPVALYGPEEGFQTSAGLHIKDTHLGGTHYPELFIRVYPDEAYPHIRLYRCGGPKDFGVSGLEVPQGLRDEVRQQLPQWQALLLTPENVRCASLRCARRELREHTAQVAQWEEHVRRWDAVNPTQGTTP